MKKKIEKILKADGFKINIHGDAWDKDNTRVYFDDIDIVVVRFDTAKNQIINWKNTIDGNMPIDGVASILFSMARV